MKYGVWKRESIPGIASEVVEMFGGNIHHVCLLVEVAAAETLCGSALDNTPGDKCGVGLCQFDPIGFIDTHERTRSHRCEIFEREFGAGWDHLQLSNLEFSPAVSLAFVRLKFMLVPEAVPVTLAGRAAYWKKYFNSEAGAGTAQEYIDRCWDTLPGVWADWVKIIDLDNGS